MKKITCLLFLLPLLATAQSKTSGTISVSGASAFFTLNNTTQVATLTLSGPSDRWMACQFGAFSGGMEAGVDVVYFNGTTLVDATHNGIGIAPSPDAQNNWTVTQNTVATGVRTVVATRLFDSPDATDYDFVYANTTLGIAVARGNSASFSLSNHTPANRIYDTAVGFTLGADDFSLESSQVFPNPSSGNFTVKTKTALAEINIYTQTGAFVRSIAVGAENDSAEVTVNGLASGVYMMELVNDTQKSWKKIVVR